MSQGGFQSFQSGCGMCNASKDYADIYYSQNPTLSTPTQAGAGKKKRTTKKRSTSSKSKKRTTTKKRSTSTKKRSTSTKKRTTSTKKRTVTKRKPMKKMRGGSKDAFELDEQFIKDNLGISFETVSGGGENKGTLVTALRNRVTNKQFIITEDQSNLQKYAYVTYNDKMFRVTSDNSQYYVQYENQFVNSQSPIYASEPMDNIVTQIFNKIKNYKPKTSSSMYSMYGGAASPLPSEWYNRRKFMDGAILPGYDVMENKLSPITGGKKKRSTKKKSVKKSTSTKKKSVKKSSKSGKKKTSTKKH